MSKKNEDEAKEWVDTFMKGGNAGDPILDSMCRKSIQGLGLEKAEELITFFRWAQDTFSHHLETLMLQELICDQLEDGPDPYERSVLSFIEGVQTMYTYLIKHGYNLDGYDQHKSDSDEED